MKTLIENPKLTEQQLTETAQQSAKHFLQCFKEDSLDVIGTVRLLSDCCINNNYLAIHLGLLRFCKLYKRTLPPQYLEIASDGDAYDYYCQVLSLNLSNMVSEQK